MIIVTAAIIEDGGKILITQRKKGANEELKWEFPGGKLEEGESPEECLIREIKEELGIDIEVEQAFDIIYHEYSKITILLLVYKCKLLGGNIQAIDCNDFVWILPEEMTKYTFAEADIGVVKKILEQ